MSRLQRAESDAALHTGPNAPSGVPAHSITPAATPAASSARAATLSSLFYQVHCLGRPYRRYHVCHGFSALRATPRCTLAPMRRLASQHTPSYPLQRQLPRRREL